MGDEQLQVLQMVAAGTITPEQGDDLLSALEGPRPRLAPIQARERSDMNEWSGMRATSRTLARLSEARLHGVTPEYIRSLADLGYADLPLEQYIELLTHGITPEYIREMRDGGYIDLSPHDLIQLRVSGVNPDYVRDMIDLGFGARDSVPAAHNQAGSVESEER